MTRSLTPEQERDTIMATKAKRPAPKMPMKGPQPFPPFSPAAPAPYAKPKKKK